MSTFVFGDQTIQVDPVNEASFEAAGWARVGEPKKKSGKARVPDPVDPVEPVEAEAPVESPPDAAAGE